LPQPAPALPGTARETALGSDLSIGRAQRRSTGCVQDNPSSGSAAVYSQAAEEIGQESDRLARVQDEALADAHAEAPAKVLEVDDGAVMHVGRLIPLVGQGLGYRHAAEGDLQARAPVAEVREADDHLAADAQHLAHQELGAMDGLQRLGEHDAVERVVGEERQAALQIDLQHVYIVGYAVEHALVVDLDAVAGRRALLP